MSSHEGAGGPPPALTPYFASSGPTVSRSSSCICSSISSFDASALPSTHPSISSMTFWMLSTSSSSILLRSSFCFSAAFTP